MVPANPTARATEVRSRRAALKREIAARPELAREVLEGRADHGSMSTAGDMKVADLVRAVPGIGDVAAAAILDGIPTNARLWALTMERRREIAGRLENP